ncbi:oligosaccharide biosynthesis protein Alg14 like protein [Marvinbryantia formatexigens DSM 14469]|uniref:Oligosaccharide biosynthesis protein Alg14 like protein n=1 Tax=Marvinbryantia formatexigens DSM 14469 TaxID=478749 RepID=C6LCS0_9FIRM|nr:PssD/Cps14F family polysaccharide biosynthesis glycosyltransferase [Marvinbryantia formatexigens]EET61734.1 oligosaccharide biosynthesis protein Alg14 like protein [Marvinbryantia formatexigens DSM 14469]UWO24454.1 UDP-N-acetylglucosamine transferase subunit ALG14 [Marvinbryantia formatexigens DSM 14469]SDF08498.1 Oligosaccharide biosynthesis protein Alg14 like [Marvinbryantia formatexigens]
MKKVCFICSAGGHLEQIRQLQPIANTYDCFYVTVKTKATEHIKERKYFSDDLNRKSKFAGIISICRMFFQQMKIFLLEKPDAIITTGAAVAIPMCIIGHFFKKKVIYIESYARMNSVNRSGKVIYRVADLFIVQWQELLRYYPKAVYGGCIY